MSKETFGTWIAFVCGILATIAVWTTTAYIVEKTKVDSGFLTFDNATYRVIPFDTLDKPKEPK